MYLFNTYSKKKEELCKTIPFFDKGWSEKILKAKKLNAYYSIILY